MYGMVNNAIEELIRSQFGDEAWEKIKDEADLDYEIFIRNDPYPDKVTYDLVSAASRVLDVPAGDLLFAFGEYWVLETARRGYGDLMQAGGKNLPDFLTNLPSFHTRVVMIFPKLQPPTFSVTDRTDHSLQVHYETNRPGLTLFAKGLLSGLAKMFKTDAKITLVEEKEKGADHDVFLVDWSTQ
ncbi:MAG: heme NO-binding domain-containing protein [Acidobacteriota bacterium]|nr:MAG: heme NO-binding domain-containing protein [Acidobacteriota bacterium]